MNHLLNPFDTTPLRLNRGVFPSLVAGDVYSALLRRNTGVGVDGTLNGTVTPAMSQLGRGPTAAAQNNWLRYTLPVNLGTTFTLVAVATPTSTGSGVVRCIVDNDPVSSGRHFQFRYYNNGGTPQFDFIRFDNGGTPSAYTATASPGSGADVLPWHVVATSNGTAMAIWAYCPITGKLVTGTQTITGTPSTANTALVVANSSYTSAASGWGAIVPAWAALNQALNAAQAQALVRNPWQLFQPIYDEDWLFVVSAGTTYAGGLSESGSMADAVAGAAVLAGTESESGSGADVQGGALVLTGGVLEAGSGADVQSGALVLPGGVSETGSGADVVDTVSGTPATLAESGGATDSVAAAVVLVAAAVEAGTGTDTAGAAAVLRGSVAETGTLADLVASGAAADLPPNAVVLITRARSRRLTVAPQGRTITARAA